MLDQAVGQFLEMASQEPSLTMVRPNGPPAEAQYQIVIEDERARALQLSLDAINQTLSTAWGSAYVNDFIDRGRTKKYSFRGAGIHGCCLTTSMRGMCATVKATWCHFPTCSR